jgi:hypothetical protein
MMSRWRALATSTSTRAISLLTSSFGFQFVDANGRLFCL